MVQEDIKEEIDRLLFVPIGAVYDCVDGYERVRVQSYTEHGELVIERVKAGTIMSTRIDLLEFHWFYEPATWETPT
jgi:hypothetical protein